MEKTVAIKENGDSEPPLNQMPRTLAFLSLAGGGAGEFIDRLGMHENQRRLATASSPSLLVSHILD